MLDRLLEARGISIEAVSGASAGAVNAALLAQGLAQGTEAAARTTLRDFWEQLGQFAPAGGNGMATGFATAAFTMMTRMWAPALWNPLDLNPLRDMLTRAIDFDALRARSPIELYIAATRVATGTLRIFRERELSCDVLLASACLPLLARTIEIDGEAYWDGGLAANPPLAALVDGSTADDLVLITMQPHRRDQLPQQADEISARMSEISFTSAFFAELQGILDARRAARRQWFPIGRNIRRLRRLRLHVIDGGDLTAQLAPASRMDVSREFTESLFEHGRERAQRWLDQPLPVNAASVEDLLFVKSRAS